MDKHLHQLDWDYIRSFLAVADTGSLTAAAKQTGISQPSLGRHIRAAEARLGAELFTRHRTGLELTDFGRLLLAPAREMAIASARFSSAALGGKQGLRGTVRITASVVVSHFLLPPIIADLRRHEPDIEIELVPSDQVENLIFREADIAIRMFRPTQLDIITHKIAEQKMALYAHGDLIARFGQAETIDALTKFPFVGFDRSELIIRIMRELGLNVDRHFFSVRCDDQAAYWRLVCAGCGVGAMQCVIGDAEPRVSRLSLQPELPSLPIWLAAQDNVFKNVRTKRVWDHLATSFSSS